MAKSFTLKSEDINIHLSVALDYFGSKEYQGTWRGFSLYTASTKGLRPDTYWYAVKDETAYTDRGLAGLLQYIDKLTNTKI